MRLFSTSYLFLCTLCVAIFAIGCDPTPDSEPNTPVGNAEFTFANITSDYTSLSLDILPKDKEREYIVYLSEVSYFTNNNITSTEQLIEDDRAYFSSLADYYGVSIRDLLQGVGLLLTGDKLGFESVDLKPGIDYVLYCYGVEFEGEDYNVTTDICHTVITTGSAKIIDVDFTVETSTNGNIVDIAVTPDTHYSGNYYIYVADAYDPVFVLQGTDFTDKHLAALRASAYAIFQRNDGSGIPKDKYCYQGATTITRRLDINTNYMVAVFAVSGDSIPMLCSEPVINYVRTEGLTLSDMAFDIDISDITPYAAQLTITPSTTDTYTAIMVAGETLDAMSEDETEMLLTFVDYFQPITIQGPYEEYLTPLNPGTEYAVVAFGYEDGYPTSHITIKRFTALEATEGSNRVEDINILKVFDIEEVVALDSSFAPYAEECECIAIVEAVTTTPTDNLYYWWYEEFMRYENPYEAYLEDLLYYGYTPSPQVLGLWYDFEFFFAGMAEDENGDLSEIYFSEPFVLTPEDCSPAEEFIDMIASSRAVAPTVYRVR